MILGKRGIAGSMVFTLLDRSALYQMIHDGNHHYYRHEYEPTALQAGLSTTPTFWENYANIFASGPDGQTNTVDTIKSPADYLDQVMPFDVTIVAQNEYGLAAWMAILGVEILNEGGGLSVDDITNEEQCTYVCRTKTPWIPWNTSTEAFQLDSSGLPQGESSVRVLRTPDQTNQIGLADLEDAYLNRSTAT